MELDLAGESIAQETLIQALRWNGGEEGRDVRNGHQQLLIGITLQSRCLGKSLVPSLLDNCLSSPWVCLVEGTDSVEVDVWMEGVLDSWGDVIVVVMFVVAVASVAVIVSVVMSRHFCVFDLLVVVCCLGIED